MFIVRSSNAKTDTMLKLGRCHAFMPCGQDLTSGLTSTVPRMGFWGGSELCAFWLPAVDNAEQAGMQARQAMIVRLLTETGDLGSPDDKTRRHDERFSKADRTCILYLLDDVR